MERSRIIGIVDRTHADDADGRRVERLCALAERAFGGRERALRWLRRPRREFGGVSPLEMMETPAAARQVEAILVQLAAERDS